MDLYRFLPISIDSCGCLWIHMDAYVFPLDFYGLLWIRMDSYGFLWISIDFCGFLWIHMDISMDFYGFLSMEREKRIYQIGCQQTPDIWAYQLPSLGKSLNSWRVLHGVKTGVQPWHCAYNHCVSVLWMLCERFLSAVLRWALCECRGNSVSALWAQG